MIGELVGYVLPKKDACGRSPEDISIFQGVPCRAIEINKNTKSVLVLSPSGKSLGMFDLDQIYAYFECREFAGILVPAHFDSIQASLYAARVRSYPQNQKRDMDFIKKMVIAQSLAKGCFCYSIYFNFSDTPTP